MRYLKKLKIKLQSNKIFYFLLIISLIYTFFYINLIVVKSKYNDDNKELYGIITDYKKSDDKTVITVKGKEKVLINYYNNINVSYGDTIYVKGKFYKPKSNTNFNLFNYKNYLLSNNIKYIVNANHIKIIKKNNSIFYNLKNKLLKRIELITNSKGYIKTFIYADKSLIDDEMNDNYRKLGISHLFAVSGMHVSLFSVILLKILKKFNDKIKYFIVIIFLFLYLFLTNYTISMLRAVFQFILILLNKYFNLNIKNSNIVIFLFSIFLIINPYNIYNIGFLFSFIVSYTLIYKSKLLTEDYLTNLLKSSILSFFSSMPILVNNFFMVNFASIILNIIYIPFVSYILFPLCILTVIFPFLDKFTYFFINIFESFTNIFSSNNLLTFYVSKMNIFLVIIYYFIFIWVLKNKKNIIKKILVVFIFLIFLINNNRFVLNSEISFIDVGQGDCTLIRIKNKNVLIDTGGNINYDISKNTLEPYLKSVGVKKIHFIIISHGDFDHMGCAQSFVNNFNVENVIFNNGEYNDLENDLIKVLKKKNIKYYKNIELINIENIKFQFLNSSMIYDNENDNSNVIYMNLNNYKILFMGDASTKREEDIINNYNLSNIDILKVGHHGSKTSSDKLFIDKINPVYSIISVGENNKYGHPNLNVLENLKDTIIYRTDKNGEIKIKLKRKLKIKICIK